MLILFDNNVPRGLARALHAHTVVESRERGWHLLKNGELLKAAEDAAFDVFITSDKNIRYQVGSDQAEARVGSFKSGPLATCPPKTRSHCRRCGSGRTRQLYRG